MPFLRFIHRFKNSSGDILALLFLWVLVLIKISPYLLSDEPVAGWDSPGHYHLAEVYDRLFSTFDSRGYDPDWFRGFPAFYYYPTMLYFLSSVFKFIIPFIDTTIESFNFALVISLLYLTFSLFRFAKIVLPDNIKKSTRILGAISAVIIYYIYPGSGLQGVSLVGFVEGTYNTALSVGFAISSIYWLERYRRFRQNLFYFSHLIALSLVFYTHFLTAAFSYIIIAIYYVFFRREFFYHRILLTFIIPVLTSLPITAPVFFYGEWGTGEPLVDRYNGFVSLLGVDFLNILLRSEFDWQELAGHFIIQLGIVHFIIVSLFILGLFTIFFSNKRSLFNLFMITIVLFFFWATQDESLVYLFSFLPIHWYRMFDLFYLFFSFLTILSFIEISPHILAKQTAIHLLFLIILVLRFLVFDPWVHEKIQSPEYYKNWNEGESFRKLQSTISRLPAGSLIFSDIVANGELHGSPHFFDLLIHKNKLRSLNGLMVESSFTSSINDSFTVNAIPGYFIWGRSPLWVKKNVFDSSLNYGNDFQSLINYLQESGVNYIFSRSRTMDAILSHAHPIVTRIFHAEPYSVYEMKGELPSIMISSAPTGYINAELLDSIKISKKISIDKFTHGVRILMKSHEASPSKIINLDPLLMNGNKRFPSLPKLYSLIIYNHKGIRKAPVLPDSWLDKDIRIIFINMTPSGDQITKNKKPSLYYLFTKHPKKNAALKYSDILTEKDPRPVAVKVTRRDYKGLSFETLQSGENENHDGCDHIYMTDSYTPFWKIESDVPPMQTGINGTYICTSNKVNKLDFAAPLSKTLTFFMILLLISYSGLELISSLQKSDQFNPVDY